MNPMQDFKVVRVLSPDAIYDDTTPTATVIDTKGFDYCNIIVNLGASDIAMGALKVQESDDNGSSDAYADVTDLVVGTAANIDGTTSALPSGTDDHKFVVFDIDCRKVERYLKLVATAGNGSTGTYLSALGLLSRARDIPVTVAGRGADEVLRI